LSNVYIADIYGEQIMTISKNDSQTRWRKRLKSALLYMYGETCIFCGFSSDIEFAHKSQSHQGSGRGFDNRMRDLREHPEKYFLLCKRCHIKYDRFETVIE
jgi:hypothetical protein